MTLSEDIAPRIDRLREMAVALPLVHPFREEILEAFDQPNPELVFFRLSHLDDFGKIPKEWKPILEEIWQRVR